MRRREFVGRGLAASGLLSSQLRAAPEPVPDASIASKQEQRILFFDESVVAERSAVQLIPPPLEKRGPVVQGDSPGDRSGAMTGMGGTPIAVDNGYRLYYTGFSEQIRGDATRGICVAESSTGLAWKKPALSQFQINGENSNRLRIDGLPDGSSPGEPTVLRLKDGRFRIYTWVINAQPRWNRYIVADSPDGLNWKAVNVEHPCIRHPHDVAPWAMAHGPEVYRRWTASGGSEEDFLKWRRIRSNDATTVYELPQGGYEMFSVWLLPNAPYGGRRPAHDNIPDELRVIHRRTSDDGLQWSDPELIVVPDAEDAWDQQFYYLSQQHLLALRVGFLGHYRVGDQTMDIEFAYSRDGRVWRRPMRGPWLPRGAPGAPDSTMVFMPQSLIDRKDHWIGLYTGADFTHGKPKGNQKFSVHAVTIPRYRFAGLGSAASLTARIRTAPFILNGPKLMLDAAISGSLRAELCDAFGKPIPGFTLADSEVIRGDAPSHELRWKNAEISDYRYEAASVRLEWNHGVTYGLKIS